MADILQWPDGVCPSSQSWRLESNTKTFRSPFNGATQVARYPGSRWRCSVTLSNQSDAESRQIEALLAALDGEWGRVKLRDWGRSGREPAGSPVVSQADQTGVLIHTSGWHPGQTVLRAGDYITVNSEMKMITADVVSDAQGLAVLTVGPALRSSPPLNTPIETRTPWGVFKLVDNNQGNGERTPGVFTSFTMEFEEAF